MAARNQRKNFKRKRNENGQTTLTSKVPKTESQLDLNELQNCYFPMRKNCSVTLYQDACTPQLPLFDKIKMADKTTYKATNAFQDMHDAIVNAKHFIYFTDWSLWHEVTLVRGDGVKETSVGELLKHKADVEGVTVLGLIWESHFKFLETFDKEAEKFFEGSKVETLHVANKGLIRHPFSHFAYSHHQKCLMMDAPHPDDPDKIQLIAFVGGLDLTKGRYDSLDHHLFSTLETLHKHDFYQNCAKDIDPKYGPRQPWHDIHSKLMGKIAYDEIQNFEERWKKEAPSHLKNKLLTLADIPRCFYPFNNFTEDSWNCQMFRSITGSSAELNPDTLNAIGAKVKAEKYEDDSIQRAYIQQIQRAEKFIYIENQFFIGSSEEWEWSRWKYPFKGRPNANQQIPHEIVKKIIQKIEAREPFHVYVVIPLYPEGKPDTWQYDFTSEEILYFQVKTMEMMYSKIIKAIETTGRKDVTAQDYLTFYFLGKREVEDLNLPVPPDPDSVEGKLRKTRRFMIYVHAKMMIVDDSYIIVGSANLNQRSMDGGRDTEIAMGSYQPKYRVKDGLLPKGRVYGFRRALFAEHLRSDCNAFDDPSSTECIEAVKNLSKGNWKIYKGKEVKQTQGHLMPYPVEIGSDGKITESRDFKEIEEIHPHLGGKLLPFIPDNIYNAPNPVIGQLHMS